MERHTIYGIFALLFLSCVPDEPEESGITGACVRSFRPTLQEWEAVQGRVPEDCAYLDMVYTVQLASREEIPCEMEEGSQTIGCTQPEEQAIYLLEGRTASQLVDSSVHEWVHALADCVDGDRDRFHLRGELWNQYGTDTVEFQAQWMAEIGSCL
jgi:hypothetical protein